MAKRNVIVVGAGSWGLACAYACARRGMAVQVLEAGTIGCGSSGGVMGALAPHTPDQWEPKKQFQYEALLHAHDFWVEVDALSGIASGYGRIGRLVPLTTPRSLELALMRIETARKLWHGEFDWRVEKGHDLIAPRFMPFGVIHETFSGRVFPARAVASLAGACRALGVEIAENAPVTALGDRKVSGDWGDLTADAVIVASGAEGFGLLDAYGDHPTGGGVKGQAALLAVDLGAAPQIYADGVYIVPHAGGQTAVGSTTEKTWDDPLRTDEKLDAIIAKARAICPSVGEAPVIQRWAGLRPKARRRDPMLGPVPGLTGVFTAMGAFKIGLGLAPAVGDILARFAMGDAVDLPKSFTFPHHME
ncbi:MAG: FAD-binding oxidoreductase [Rhodobacteraceae bacterium]|nr:FAD-binding oxidoreductase [Paracoccaceae bacterium]